MRANTALKFEDGPLAGLVIVIEVDAGVDPPDTVTAWVSGPTNGGRGDDDHWWANYNVPSSAAFEPDSEHVWVGLTLSAGDQGWTTEDGPLVIRPSRGADTVVGGDTR